MENHLFSDVKTENPGNITGARFIELTYGKVKARIAPDNGGMLTSLKIEDTEILRMHYDTLRLVPVLAGGCPVLFPFPGSTDGGKYTVSGREYGMPVHGLVKNAPFGIKSVSESEAVLFMKNSPAWKESQYPFDFTLEIAYRLTESGIKISASVSNDGDTPLFHALGFHPYFLTTDKKNCRLAHSFTVYHDDAKHVDAGAPPDFSDLSEDFDHVLHTPETDFFLFENPADNYRIRMNYGADFPVLVVCSNLDGAVCVEPWGGVTDSANSRRFVKYVDPGKTETYSVEITAEKI